MYIAQPRRVDRELWDGRYKLLPDGSYTSVHARREIEDVRREVRAKAQAATTEDVKQATELVGFASPPS